MISSNMITIENFSKSFYGTRVINDLSFEVKEGEIFAFLGANGSGKTTTIRSLLGILQPDSGQLVIKGAPYKPERSKILGYLPEERGLYTSSRVLETMVYFGQLKGMKKNDAEQSALTYLERVGLSEKRDETIKKLSSGQQQKIQLGITVINRPELLILDEPTKGLDPVNRDLLMELLLELNNEGASIMFSTHQMEEAEKVAHRLLMIKDGEKALYGGLEEVKEQFGANTLHIEYSGKFPLNKKLYSASVNPKLAEVTPNEGISSEEILRYLIDKVKVHSFTKSTPSLHQIFIKVTNENV